jgi:hypothetical protein
LKKVVHGLSYVKEIHITLIEKSKKTMNANELMKTQIKAQDNMIKDLVG